jgi:hypothetical protein
MLRQAQHEQLLFLFVHFSFFDRFLSPLLVLELNDMLSQREADEAN